MLSNDFLWVHGDMNSKQNMMDGASFNLFLRWQDYTAVPEDNSVCRALLHGNCQCASWTAKFLRKSKCGCPHGAEAAQRQVLAVWGGNLAGKFSKVDTAFGGGCWLWMIGRLHEW